MTPTVAPNGIKRLAMRKGRLKPLESFPKPGMRQRVSCDRQVLPQEPMI